jgi:ATP-binding cassette subfamily B multidrug efflux pump
LGGLASISLLLILATGAGAIADGALSVGDFIAMVLYVERLVFPTALLGFTITAYQRGEVSIDRVEAILTSQPKIVDAPRPKRLPSETIRGQLSARDLNFAYPDSKTPALNGVSFHHSTGRNGGDRRPHWLRQIDPGQCPAAPAGYCPGANLFDGQDITEIPLADLRKAIAYVPQESFLFSTTINNNIRYGEPLAELPEVKHAAKLAQIARKSTTSPSSTTPLWASGALPYPGANGSDRPCPGPDDRSARWWCSTMPSPASITKPPPTFSTT